MFAPELHGGEEKEATEGTLSFVVGMILSSVVTYKVLFYDMDGFEAGMKICEDLRLNIDPHRETSFAKLTGACLDHDAEKSPDLKELKRESLTMLPEGSKRMTKCEMVDIMIYSSTDWSCDDEDDENGIGASN